VTRRLVLLAALLAAVAGCGGSSGSSSSSAGSQADSSSSLVTKVEHAKAEVEGKSVVGSVRVTEGGEPGQRLSLRCGLVDAVSGVRASQEEKLVATYTTTSSVDTKDVSIRFPKPSPTDYLVHFVLYGPDGSYLASSDSPVFSVR
jgi:Flp pilus assembly protein TadD